MSIGLSAMPETAYYILLSLVEERHGYGIMQYVSSITDRRVSLGAGTLYGTLSKLEKSNWIYSTKEEDKRKYYLITEEGTKVLKSEVLRIEELYQHGKAVLLDGRE